METERLWLRKFNISTGDADFVIQMLNTPGWLKYIGDSNIKTRKKAKNYIVLGPLSSYQKYNFGLLLVQLKSSGRPIGMCGLIKRKDLDYPDLGFAFLPQYIGKGYAYEAASAIISHAKNDLNLSEIASITTLRNEKSIKLLLRLGFSFKKNITLNKEKLKLFSLK